MAVKFLGGLWKIEQDVENLQAKVMEVDNKVANIQEGNFTQEMIQTVKQITLEQNQEKHESSSAEEVITLIEAKNKDQRKEIEDRLRRKANLVMFKAPEDTTKTTQERQKEVDILVQQILNEIQTAHKPTDIRRLGNIKKDQGEPERPRTLRMTF